MPNTFFIADTHFSHKNIITYCNRPFQDIGEMNTILVAKWNSIVKPDDIVYHLGDFAISKPNIADDILIKLNGKKYLIFGNHDTKMGYRRTDKRWYEIYDKPIVFDKFWILSHEPMEFVLDNTPFANIYGHVHNDPKYKDFTTRTFCASVERINYAPVALEEIRERLISCEK